MYDDLDYSAFANLNLRTLKQKVQNGHRYSIITNYKFKSMDGFRIMNSCSWNG